jgi:DNA topoisomerase-1
MTTFLVITEKPRVAEKIAHALAGKLPGKKALGGVTYYDFAKSGDRILVVPAVGHLYSLKQKTEGSGYPVFDLEWVPLSQVEKKAAFSSKYLNALKKLSKEADVLVNACDWDVEGSLIGGNVIRFAAGKGKQAKRMFFSTLTDEDLKTAFDNKGALDVSTIDAGEARHILDWLWGINASRALMAALKSAGIFRIMSIGRVQGPALAFLAEREKQIQEFKSTPYWQLFALAKAAVFTHVKDRFLDESEADKALKESDKNAVVKSVDRKQFEQPAPFPFDLTSLQTEAFKTMGLQPSHTLRLAQDLYEAAAISYPRTSSQQLSEKLDLKKILSQLASQSAYAKSALELIERKRFTPHNGPKKDPAHPAIHPTGVKPGKVSLESLKLYDLIVKRFLATFAPSAQREKLKITLACGKQDYAAEGVHTLSKGWFDFYSPYLRLEEKTLPEFKQGEKVSVEKFWKEQKETQPPQRFTTASVIRKLEEHDLGTKATRSAIIDTLFDRNYAMGGKNIQVTPLGMAVYASLQAHVPEIVLENLTRDFEKQIVEIENKKRSKEDVVAKGRKELEKIAFEFKRDEKEIGKELLEAVNATQRQESVLGKCNLCANDLVLRRSKYGLFVGCSGYPNCKNIFPLPKNALIKAEGKACEKCGTPIVKVIRKGKRPFLMCLKTDCETKKDWGKTGAKNENNA